MKIRVLQTVGEGTFKEVEWDKPEPVTGEIEVKAIITGVCRSDIDMMIGQFGPLPLHMQGHEGLGVVTKVTESMSRFAAVGDIVATRGEPAYGDYYNVRLSEFVIVPEASPKYIIEPVACGINVVQQAITEFEQRAGIGKKLLIIGSGMLAWVAYNTLKLRNLEFEIDVIGSHNKEVWGEGFLKTEPNGTYDVIIDLGSNTMVFDNVIYNENALIICGSQKKVTTDFSGMLWKSVTMVFPSPRTPVFYSCMLIGVDWIKNGKLTVDHFWSKGYNRNMNWQGAFTDGLTRPHNYNRGYIIWE
jgi:NADPH:quinone reductase-like Zn-dependent oxidoreductase